MSVLSRLKWQLSLILMLICVGCSTIMVPAMSPDVVLRSLNACPKVFVPAGSGSSVCIQKTAKTTYFLTCYHVINDCNGQVKVYFGASGPLVDARLGAADKSMDLAMLEIDDCPVDTPVVRIATQDPRVGDELFTAGAPQGFPYLTTFGHLSTPNSANIEGCEVWILDMAVIGGNSGGGLFNSFGQLVGIVEAKVPGTNISIAITSNQVKTFLKW